MTNDERKPTAAEHFSRQAAEYARSPSHAAGEDLEVVARFAEAGPGETCLDVATGPGHTARRIAAHARCVVGIDVAEGMIARATDMAVEAGLVNALFMVADVQALPFPAATFDLVTCRIAPHHFTDVPCAMREVARVLKSGGRFVLEDSMGPEDAEIGAFLDRFERERDPTHVHCLPRSEWLAVLADAGLGVVREAVLPKRHDFVAWVQYAGCSDAEVAALARLAASAPEAFRQRYLDFEGDRPTHFHDEKLIVRAEHATIG